MKGYLSVVLHAHLPFVRHPEHEDFLEEDWLYEAISETYLPLLDAFDRLAQERTSFRITITLSPTLLSMLQDELLMERYSKHLDRTCELAEKEVHRTRRGPFHRVALFYRDHFSKLQKAFHQRHRRNLVSAFGKLQEAGQLEIIACCATHAFLPLLQNQPESVRAQIGVGADHYRQTFGRDPIGIWLPECGYFPGIEQTLAAQGIRFFFLDTHGVMNGNPPPIYAVYAPVYTEAGVAAFGRDPESSQQVWSAERGYPADPVYREFYRDVGWDLDYQYIRPYIQATGQRKNTGLKYFRITGQGDDKEPYEPERARERAAIHAADFASKREQQIKHLAARMDGRKPIVTAPYDAELFGHWWFEGPAFLEAMLRHSALKQSTYELATPVEFLRDNPEHQVSTLAMSSWGERGYAGTWLDESNDWVYRHLHRCGQLMAELARDFSEPDPLERRALNQAARELLLAQSSDWAFIMKTGTMVEYAIRRTREHVERFLRLNTALRNRSVDPPSLAQIEGCDNIFPALDYRVYRAAETS